MNKEGCLVEESREIDFLWLSRELAYEENSGRCLMTAEDLIFQNNKIT